MIGAVAALITVVLVRSNSRHSRVRSLEIDTDSSGRRVGEHSSRTLPLVRRVGVGVQEADRDAADAGVDEVARDRADLARVDTARAPPRCSSCGRRSPGASAERRAAPA